MIFRKWKNVSKNDALFLFAHLLAVLQALYAGMPGRQKTGNNELCAAMSTMNTYNLPQDLQKYNTVNDTNDLSIFNYEVPATVIKNKINLNKHVLSFLVEGEKDVRFADTAVRIDTSKSLLIASGNFLMTEYIGGTCFKCLLFFFSEKNIVDFLSKHSGHISARKPESLTGIRSYFQIEKDPFIIHFINSLAQSFELRGAVTQKILALKFEEILLYLTDKYGVSFLSYLQSLLVSKRELSFKTIVEENVYSNLSIEEVAFLCNMSLSTFKRQFMNIYQAPPGKWFQKKRLDKAKEMLRLNNLKPSEIYMDFGYNDLSSFSIAFKKEFGKSPKQASLL